MADQPQQFEPDPADADENARRRSFLSVMVALVVIVLIALLLLMLRSCKSDEGRGGGTSDSQTIESVKGLDPEPGAVSLWVSEGGDIDGLLTAADVRAADIVNMGGGRYVIAVAEGSEVKTVAKLRRVDGVIDAGLVYATGEKK